MLRDYQIGCLDGLRGLMLNHRTAVLQLCTGGGKTAIISEITHTAWGRGHLVWFMVPRNELVQQASEHFKKWKVPHALITATRYESSAYAVHIVSKDTLLSRMRLGRVKRWPDLLIVDEAHIAIEQQARILQALPVHTKVIGVTATPERSDGIGLAATAGGIYDAIHYGPSIPWLTERGFLAPLRYFAPPPPEGFDKLHWRGTEVVERDFDAFLDRNKRVVYGNVIEFYRKHGRREHPAQGQNPNRPALIFTRSVKSAKETAAAFTDAGFDFRPIWGEMPTRDRNFAFRALREERIDGLVNCDLATYGVDVPNLEYGASIRPTLSRALYFQMVGRILRPYPGKEAALFFDHANLVQEHQEPSAPGVPLFYLNDLAWNFAGRETRKRAAAESSVRLCPRRDYLYCNDPACRGGCRLEPASERGRGDLETVDAQLHEITPAARPWSVLEPGERREVQDRIGSATDAYLAGLAADPPRFEAGPVGELLAVATELGRSPMWVYWHCVERDPGGRRAVNIPLLHEIARQKGYKKGWAWWKRQEIERGIKESAELEEVRV